LKESEKDQEMAVDGTGLGIFTEALVEQGFSRTDEFGLFVTYERANDSLKIHIGPDGSFAAFDGNDEVVTEGTGAHDLYSILVDKTASVRRHVLPHRPARRHSV
jgi:hypothetical protein